MTEIIKVRFTHLYGRINVLLSNAIEEIKVTGNYTPTLEKIAFMNI